MGVKTYRPDDPEFAAYIGATSVRAAEVQNNPPPPYHPSFGDYIAGKTGQITEEKKPMATERAEHDEIVTLPDGRQIQIQAAGAPKVDEKLAARERELAQQTVDQADVDHLHEIQPDTPIRALRVTGNERAVSSQGALGPQVSRTITPAPTEPAAPKTINTQAPAKR